MNLDFILSPAQKGLRFDQVICAALRASGLDVSAREIRVALRSGLIQVNGRACSPGDRARGAEHVALDRFIPRTQAEIACSPEVVAPVVYLDDALLALNKPSGVPTAPLKSGEKGTLLGAAVALYPEIARAGPPLEGGLLHRLDGETSGVVLFARDLQVRTRLRASFRAHEIEKRYWAVVIDRLGCLPEFSSLRGAIVSPRSGVRVRVRVHASDSEEGGGTGLSARTDVRVLRRLDHGLAVIEAITCTGRRHQVRAHLSAAGAPIAGDLLYGGESVRAVIPRLALHAVQVKLKSGLTIAAKVPEELLPWMDDC